MYLTSINIHFQKELYCYIDFLFNQNFEKKSIFFVTSRPGADHFPGPLHYRSTILSALGPDYALTVLFLGTHTRTSRWVTHPGIALVRYSLNFGVPTEPKASELPKGLALGRDGNIHIRITPLGDVGSHNPPPLGA